MVRKNEETKESKDLLNEMIPKQQESGEIDIETMPLNTYYDYMAYNAKARVLNKKLKLCRYPIKQCPVELHDHVRISFSRTDKNTHYIPAYFSNDQIHYNEKLYPNKEYSVPRIIAEYLASKGTEIWKWYTNPDGSKETRMANIDPRFSVRTIY